MEMVSSVPVAQQAMIILMMSLFSRSSACVLLCMPQSAPECIKFSWGCMPQTSLQWMTVGRPCGSPLQLMTLPPQMEKVMYGPALYNNPATFGHTPWWDYGAVPFINCGWHHSLPNLVPRLSPYCLGTRLLFACTNTKTLLWKEAIRVSCDNVEWHCHSSQEVLKAYILLNEFWKTVFQEVLILVHI